MKTIKFLGTIILALIIVILLEVIPTPQKAYAGGGFPVDSAPNNGVAAVFNTTLTNCRGVNASVAGIVYVDFLGGGTDVPMYVQAGSNAMHITKVYTTGTTATIITELY